jgi:penicillin-binding protein 1A
LAGKIAVGYKDKWCGAERRRPLPESAEVTDMFPDPGDDWRPRFKRLLLDIDARIDFAVFQSGKWTREIYERFTAFMDRAHVAGWRRWLLVEPLSEMATLGTVGLVLMLALALPAFRQTSDDDWLKKSDLAVTFLDRYGNEVGNRGIKHNDSVPLEDMPDHLVKATLATEDRRFYEHFGIDFYGTVRALMTNAKAGGVVQGGSTITQQLAKNLFLWQGRNFVRKGLELPLALWIDLVIPKRRQLEIYLNVVEWGPNGEFGAEAAARRAFGKPARQLTAQEAALLAASLPNPVRRNPRQPGPGMRRLAGIYMARAASEKVGGCIRGRVG